VSGILIEFAVIVDEEEDEEGGKFLVDFHKKIYAKVINDYSVSVCWIRVGR